MSGNNEAKKWCTDVADYTSQLRLDSGDQEKQRNVHLGSAAGPGVGCYIMPCYGWVFPAVDIRQTQQLQLKLSSAPLWSQPGEKQPPREQAAEKTRFVVSGSSAVIAE
jgi:hypothetical protein